MANMSGKAVQSAGNTGPRDISDAISAHFDNPPRQASITVRVFLADDDLAKIAGVDVSAILREMLRHHGIAEGHIETEQRKGK